MKKNYLLLFAIFLFISLLSDAQNAFFDAQYLTSVKKSQIDIILADKDYNLTKTDSMILSDLRMFLENPYSKNINTNNFNSNSINSIFYNYTLYLGSKIKSLTKDSLPLDITIAKDIIRKLLDQDHRIAKNDLVVLKNFLKEPDFTEKKDTIETTETIVIADSIKNCKDVNDRINNIANKQGVVKKITTTGNETKITYYNIKTTVAGINPDTLKKKINEVNTIFRKIESNSKSLAIQNTIGAVQNSLSYYSEIPATINQVGTTISISTGGNSRASGSLEAYVLDGITKYYAEEFKKAATVSYFNIFNSTIGKYDEIHVLFPETFDKLKNMDPTRFPDLGRDMKDIFVKDLTKLPSNFVKYIDEFEPAPADSARIFKHNLPKKKNLTISNAKLYNDSTIHIRNTILKLFPGTENGILKNFETINLPNPVDTATLTKIKGNIDLLKTVVKALNISKKEYLINPLQIDTIKASPYYIHLKAGVVIANNILNKKHISITFKELDENYYTDSLGNRIKHSVNISELSTTDQIGIAIHGLNILQYNIQDTVTDITNPHQNIWLDKSQFKTLEKPEVSKYFAGLIYQRNTAYFDYLIAQIPDINGVRVPEANKIYDLVQSNIAVIKQKVIIIDKFVSDTLKIEKLPDYFDAVIELLRPVGPLKDKLPQYDTFCVYMKDIKNIYDGILKKDFVNTIHYSLLAIKRVLNQPGIVDGDIGPINNFLDKLNGYGTFATRVINAQNSNDIKDVIKDIAAPSSSYLFKRVYPITVTLSGHPGFFWGLERLEGQKKYAGVTGITLPIGFEFTWLFSARSNKTQLYGNFYKNHRVNDFGAMKNKWSYGIFFQFLDLGAILNYRMTNDSTQLPSNVTFKQLVSPGATLNIGLPNFPVAIGVGYQYTPRLREIKPDVGDQTPTMPNGHRFFVRVSADIPTINIFKTRGKTNNNVYKIRKKINGEHIYN